jgi:Rrf2 family protein
MLSLTKKTDYALIALGYLAEHTDQTVSAREIAETFNMPGALVMNILKTLHHANFISSTRGTKGGYRLTADLNSVSMHDLIGVLEGPVRLAECVDIEQECPQPECCKITNSCPIQGPVRALHGRLVNFLKDVKLSEVLAANCKTPIAAAPVESTSTIPAAVSV